MTDLYLAPIDRPDVLMSPAHELMANTPAGTAFLSDHGWGRRGWIVLPDSDLDWVVTQAAAEGLEIHWEEEY